MTRVWNENGGAPYEPQVSLKYFCHEVIENWALGENTQLLVCLCALGPCVWEERAIWHLYDVSLCTVESCATLFNESWSIAFKMPRSITWALVDSWCAYHGVWISYKNKQVNRYLMESKRQGMIRNDICLLCHSWMQNIQQRKLLVDWPVHVHSCSFLFFSFPVLAALAHFTACYFF